MRAPLLALLAASSLLFACTKEVPPPPPPEDLTLAKIAVSDKGVSLGGESIAPPLGDQETLIRPLIDKLRARRQKFEKEHPTQTFVGKTEIELASGTSCRAAVSVINAALVAGTWSFTLRSGATTLEVPAQQLRKERDPKGPQSVWLGFHPDGTADLNLAPCLAPYDTAAGDALPGLVQQMCGEAGDCVGEVHVGCDAKTPFDKVLPTLVALRPTIKRMELSTAPDCDAPIEPTPGEKVEPGEPKLTVRESYRGIKMEPLAKKPRYAVHVGVDNDTDASRAAAFAAAANQRKDDLAACYELGLRKNPNLMGIVKTRVLVNKKGGVMRVERHEKSEVSDMSDPLVEKCTRAALTNVTFPASDGVTRLGVSVLFTPN